MKRVVIIDDEPLARSILLEYLQPLAGVEVVQECNNGFEGVKAIQQHQPDLIFLDVQMPKINGFEMLELLDQAPAVIFTTAFEEYALRAFEAHAVDYLLKPITRERFDVAMRKWQDHAAPADATQTQALLETAAQAPGQRDRIVVRHGSKIHIIPVQQVHYLEASDDFVKIHTDHGTFLKSRTMQYFERALPDQQFVRVHRSYIVQVQQITQIDPYQKDTYVAILRSGAQVPISRTGYPRLREVLGI
ncbi:two-component system, LytT family, response regulator [Catalinimonas alkaloidigena]|uniref:Two-component system, LytT family, response regulator n=1 Tax=Catalinimonas alkaloidigena TaxID=1075417 RepID=A0A1G9H4C4_9BACT|nr:LytTR family transcriptional regulator DNA-binding domain-containing protein [Catalinimonas alkaloidigena]SDL07732.1 two-component system, LytT family, response regulator [Catalinimonas alkaloidigena]